MENHLIGLLEITVSRGDHAREGGGHLGAERNLAFTLVDEVEKLADEFAAALSCGKDRPLRASDHRSLTKP